LRNVTVRIEGPAASQAGFQKPDLERLRPGQVLNHGDYEAVKGRIESQSARFGYFAGRFVQQRILVDPVAGHADIELIYQSGERQPCGAGPPDDHDGRAARAQMRLGGGVSESGRVAAAPRRARAGESPAEARLEARTPRTFGVALGYSTDVGQRGPFVGSRH